MRGKFDRQLKQLNEEMTKMGNMIEAAIQTATQAFLAQDVKTAKQIMAGDVDVDQAQKRIEGICFQLLIQQQPVARDLRTITAAMKMVTDMERIGDHAADISELTVLMADGPYRFRGDKKTTPFNPDDFEAGGGSEQPVTPNDPVFSPAAGGRRRGFRR